MTSSELLFIWRERKGWTQEEAARRLGIGQSRYALAELGRVVFQPVPAPRNVTRVERLRIARRRTGWPLSGIAKELGVSRVTLLRYEAEAAEKLVKYWVSKGFTPP